MKKSEAIDKLLSYGQPISIGGLVELLAELGVSFDPEDPPKPELPARLYVRAPGWVKSCDQWSVVNETAPQGDAPFEPEEVLAEMVRRYNLLPAIRRRIEEHLSNPPMYGCVTFCEQLAAWIDGTEQPPEAQDGR